MTSSTNTHAIPSLNDGGWLPTVNRAAVLLICAAGVILGASLYLDYLPIAASRWQTMGHDRNAHYLSGLQLGIDVRNLDFVSLFNDFRRIRSWPPLHSLLIGAAVAIAGPNYEIAVLPNVAAWVATGIFAFLLARRLAPTSMLAGNIAGLLAATMVYASPAHRAFATDFMLESLGAALTLACLYLYVCVRQENAPAIKWLALSLTLLFFEKYNYWLLVVLAISISHVLARRSAYFCWLRDALVERQRFKFVDAERPPKTQMLRRKLYLVRISLLAIRKRMLDRVLVHMKQSGWLRRQARQPLNYLVVGLLVATVWQTEGAPPPNLTHFTYLAVLARCAVAWKGEGILVWNSLSDPAKAFVKWHVVPLAVWFALPKRLGYFLWFLSPNNIGDWETAGENSAAYYLQAAIYNYFPATWTAWLLFALMIVATISFRRQQPGFAAVCVFLCLSIVLTLNHPNQKARFLHTWISASWIIGSVGISHLIYRWSFPRFQYLKAIPSAVVALSVIASQIPYLHGAGYSYEPGHKSASTSDLIVSKAYLPWLEDTVHIAILADHPAREYCLWTYLTAYPAKPRPETDLTRWFTASAQQNQQQFDNWLNGCGADSLVLIETSMESGAYVAGFDEKRMVSDFMSSQRKFHKCETWNEIPGIHVTLWRQSKEVAAAKQTTEFK